MSVEVCWKLLFTRNLFLFAPDAACSTFLSETIDVFVYFCLKLFSSQSFIGDDKADQKIEDDYLCGFYGFFLLSRNMRVRQTGNFPEVYSLFLFLCCEPAPCKMVCTGITPPPLHPTTRVLTHEMSNLALALCLFCQRPTTWRNCWRSHNATNLSKWP